MQMGWRWDFTFEILPQMAIATLNTILAAGVGYAIALIVGLFFLLGQKTPFKIFQKVDCLRCLPQPRQSKDVVGNFFIWTFGRKCKGVSD